MANVNISGDTQEIAELDYKKAFEALSLVTLDTINALREKTVLPDLTPAQMKQALIAKYKSL